MTPLSFLAVLLLPVLTGFSAAIWSHICKSGTGGPILTCLASITGNLITLTVVALTMRANQIEIKLDAPIGLWFVYVASCVAVSLLWIYPTYIGAPYISTVLLEISYPLFVALALWLLFRDIELNRYHLIGGCIVLFGSAVVLLGNQRVE